MSTERPRLSDELTERYAAKLFAIEHPRTAWTLPRPHHGQQEQRNYYRQAARVLINNMMDDPEMQVFLINTLPKTINGLITERMSKQEYDELLDRRLSSSY